MNATLKHGASAEESITCHNLPIAAVSAITSYTLYMNYSYGGAARSLYGYLNATNAYLG
jgi:hypothetical protein